MGRKPDKRHPSDYLHILCFTVSSPAYLTCRIPSPAPEASASTSPPAAHCMSCRCAANWAANAESPYSGANGASRCCGGPTTAPLRQVKELLQLMRRMKTKWEWRKSSLPDPHQVSVSMSWWTPLLYLSGALALILMIVMLRHRERWVNHVLLVNGPKCRQTIANIVKSQPVVETVIFGHLRVK